MMHRKNRAEELFVLKQRRCPIFPFLHTGIQVVSLYSFFRKHTGKDLYSSRCLAESLEMMHDEGEVSPPPLQPVLVKKTSRARFADEFRDLVEVASPPSSPVSLSRAGSRGGSSGSSRKLPVIARGLSTIELGNHASSSRMAKIMVEELQPRDFDLPDEELADGRLTHYETALERKHEKVIKRCINAVKKERLSLSSIDSLCSIRLEEETSRVAEKMWAGDASVNKGSRCISSFSENKRRVEREAKLELDMIKRSVAKEQKKNVLIASYKSTEDFGDVSTIDYPKLGSIEEKVEDLRQEFTEAYCRKRGKKFVGKFTNAEKRMLRRWFQDLDYDGSGEVSVLELQDPLLSAGILRTREQVFRVLLNADKNNTMGLDFEVQ